MPREHIHLTHGGIDVSWSKRGYGDEVRLNVTGSEPVADPQYDDVVRRVDGPDVALDRQAINRVIRFLRTARDQAYGRDE